MEEFGVVGAPIPAVLRHGPCGGCCSRAACVHGTPCCLCVARAAMCCSACPASHGES